MVKKIQKAFVDTRRQQKQNSIVILSVQSGDRGISLTDGHIVNDYVNVREL